MARCAHYGRDIRGAHWSDHGGAGRERRGENNVASHISGLVAPKAGSIFLDEKALVGVATENIARMGVAHVPEGRGVIEELTVEENLRLVPWRPRSISPKA